MGKQKQKRNKRVNSSNDKTNEEVEMELRNFSKLDIPSNLLSKIDINLEDDIISVKSLKSIKSALGGDKVIAKKKARLKMRRQLFLKLTENANRLERDLKKRRGIRDTDTIRKRDSEKLSEVTPSLERFMETEDVKATSNRRKLRSIDKAKIRKRKLLAGIEMMKKIQANESFRNDTFAAISERVKSLIQNQV